MTDSPIAAAARDIKARYGALLAARPAEMTADTGERVAAVEAARIRAQGGRKPDAAQLSLDVSARGESSRTPSA